MSQHGCPERLSNRSKAFQDDGPSQQTMEVLVETLTGTAFEMTVSPTDTIFAIKSKIFRVEGIPVSQQHLLYNLKELDDASSLREHSISDGARLRLVLGMRGGPISTRRLPPPPNSEPWRDIERLLESNRERGSDGAEAGSSGCKVTVLVFTDGERATMLRVRENTDGTYSPVDHPKYTEYSSLSQYLEGEAEGGGGVTGVTSVSSTSGAMGATGVTGTRRDNALTLGKMLELRRRMETLSLNRAKDQALHEDCDSVEIQKTRSEESLPVSEELEEEEEEEEALAPHYDGRYTRYDYDCSFADRYTLLPPIGRSDSSQSVVPVEQTPVGGSLGEGDEGGVVCARTFGSSSQLSSLAPGAPHSASSVLRPALSDALFSSSTSDLESLKRNRLLPALSRHRNREHLHLSDDQLHLRDSQPPSQPQEKSKKVRIRCGFCKKRLSIATVHRCRCGAEFCAPHRYAEVHGCAYDYKAAAHGLLRRANPLVSAPKLPKI